MRFDFGTVLAFLLVGFGFVLVSLLASRLVRPQVPTPDKLMPYECGEIPVTGAWTNFNIRFYLLALLFIIFDVEIAFMFPVGVVYRSWVEAGSGALALAEIGFFVLILVLGLIYAWVKGDMQWVKRLLEPSQRASGTDVISKASSVP